MTRAEEALFIGGALGKRETEPAADSWYARLAPLLGGDWLEDPVWGGRMEHGERAGPIHRKEQRELPMPRVLPPWTTRPPGEEPRPPRPLAPSAAGEELGADPPLTPEAAVGEGAAAARRGVLIHALLERLPDVPSAERVTRGSAWLERHARDLDSSAREEMLARALAVIAEPQWAELFSPAALAEVPLAAVVEGQVIAGTADRLLVTDESVLVVDFKTARRPPASLEQVSAATLRQMGAYAAALAKIYPGRSVRAAVLYTQLPLLLAIPPELLAAHKPGFPPVQETYVS
jgi:ATP-dependent helicase/nuclease subunit A